MVGEAVQRAARRLLERGGHVVQRPVLPGADETFPVAYVRTVPRRTPPAALPRGRAPRAGTAAPHQVPVLFVPGGPGLASVLPYRSLRVAAARRGMDVLMVEHRGVGLSRRDGRGRDLPLAAVTIEQAADDLAAVLDHAGVDRAVVYGSSYGSYLAQALAARHPHRVAGMVLDSPLLSVEADLAAVRAHRRRLLWDGEEAALAPVAAAVRDLAGAGVPMSQVARVVQVVHEFAGPDVLHRLLLARRRGRLQRTWQRIATLGTDEVDGGGTPFVNEPDLVADISYRQLGFGLPPDGGPLDPQLTVVAAARRHTPYGGEPFDLPAELRRFTGPLVVVSGDRDLRTPRPVAQRITELAPHAVLVPLADTGHSALDSHPSAALVIAAAAAAGTTDRLPALAGALAALPRRGPSRLLGTALTALVTASTRAPDHGPTHLPNGSRR